MHSNPTGYVVGLAGFGTDVFTYAVLSDVVGETPSVKGCAWIAGGVVRSICDVLAWIDRCSAQPRFRWLSHWSGGMLGMPVFVHGFLAIVGGLGFLFSLWENR
jgi:hypothetical protein